MRHRGPNAGRRTPSASSVSLLAVVEGGAHAFSSVDRIHTPLWSVYTNVYSMRFQWDPEKAESNFIRHGIDFDDAVLIFDGMTVEVEDDRFGYGEIRVRAIGVSRSRLVVVIYTMRGEICRIISARMATRHEQKTYRDAERR